MYDEPNPYVKRKKLAKIKSKNKNKNTKGCSEGKIQ